MLGAVLASLAGATSAQAMSPKTFNPLVEAENYSITLQRQTIYDTPQYQAQLAFDSVSSGAQALETQAADPGRFFTDDLCWNLGNGCAGDIRLHTGPTGARQVVGGSGNRKRWRFASTCPKQIAIVRGGEKRPLRRDRWPSRRRP